VWDVQSGRIPECSMQFNVYGVELQPVGALVTFFGYSAPEACSVPLDMLAAVLCKHLGL